MHTGPAVFVGFVECCGGGEYAVGFVGGVVENHIRLSEALITHSVLLGGTANRLPSF
jgi:hypothetical protein